jgi:hypothetical protein
MNRGAFEASLNAVQDFLADIGLYEDRVYPNYTNLDVPAIRDKPYAEQFQHYVNNRFYDFLLKDQSLLIFDRYEITVNQRRYINMHWSFLDAPFQQQSFEEYKSSITGWEELSEELLLSGFEFDKVSEFRHSTPIRYDYQPQLYEAEKHSASHLHIGFNNHIRLATKKVLEPMTFALFVARNAYPENWLEAMSHARFAQWRRSIRDSIQDVADYSDLDEQCQLVIH